MASVFMQPIEDKQEAGGPKEANSGFGASLELPDHALGIGEAQHVHGLVTGAAVVASYEAIADEYYGHKRNWRTAVNLIDKPVLENLLNGSMTGRTVAVIGGGTGWDTDIVLKKNPKEVFMVEPSTAMMAIARGAITDERVKFLDDSAEHLSLPDESVDVVVSTFAFDCIVDLRGALKECRRILKPGGRLVMAIKHPQRNRLYAEHGYGQCLEGYEVGWHWEKWEGTGENVVLRRYLSEVDWINELQHAGFQSIWGHEPMPDSSVRERAPEIWEVYHGRKSTLILSATRNGVVNGG